MIHEISGRIPQATFAFESIPTVTPIRMSHLLSQWKPDILHAQTSKAHTHLWIARKLLNNAPPLIVSRRVAFPVSGGIWGYLKYRKGIAHYIPISQAAARTLREVGVSKEMMTVVPSGIDVDVFRQSRGDQRLLKQWGMEPEHFVIGSVAAFEKEKGHAVLLRAAQRIVSECQGCRFVLIGEGRLRTEVDNAVTDLALNGKVVVESMRVPLERILPLFDCFVLPSRDEGLSTALIAALASGLPVIASNVGGVPEVLTHECGILVPPGNHEALAAAILKLVRDRDFGKRLAEMGSRRAKEFDIGRTVKKTFEIYKQVLKERF